MVTVTQEKLNFPKCLFLEAPLTSFLLIPPKEKEYSGIMALGTCDSPLVCFVNIYSKVFLWLRGNAHLSPTSRKIWDSKKGQNNRLTITPYAEIVTFKGFFFHIFLHVDIILYTLTQCVNSLDSYIHEEEKCRLYTTYRSLRTFFNRT